MNINDIPFESLFDTPPPVTAVTQASASAAEPPRVTVETLAEAGSAPRRHHLTDAGQAVQTLGRLTQDAPSGLLVGLDVETTGLDPLVDRVRLVQLAVADETLIIDLWHCGVTQGRRLGEPGAVALHPVVAALEALLRQTRAVIHNATFDLAFLYHQLGLGLSALPFEDSMLAAGMLLGGRGRRTVDGQTLNEGGINTPSLQFAAHQLLGVSIPKDQRVSDWAAETLSTAQVAYAARDAELAVQVLRAAQDHPRWNPRFAQAYALARDAVPAVIRMELSGLLLDSAQHQAAIDDWQARLDTIAADKTDLSLVENLNSTAQIQAQLRATLPGDWLKDWPRTRTGQLSTKAKELRRAAPYYPALGRIADWKDTQKLMSSFGPSLQQQVHPLTGRIHANYTIAGTKTGRFTCTRPNLQQLPKRRNDTLRRAVVPAPGRRLLAVDYSQIELRVLAELADEEQMRAVYRTGGDLHATTACLFLGTDVSDFDRNNPTHTAARSTAKAINFGTVYGMGARRLRDTLHEDYGLNISIGQAETYLEQWEARYPAAAAWKQRQREEARQFGFVESPAGRRHLASWEDSLDRRWEDKIWTLSINYPVQAGAAEVSLQALALLEQRLLSVDDTVHLVAQVHDEFVFELDARDPDCDKYEETINQCLRDAFLALFPRAPAGTDLVGRGVGCCWADAH
jgi:DNA polymerase-1